MCIRDRCEKYGHWKINAQNEVGVAFRKRETRKREKCTCGRRLRRTCRSHSRRSTGYKFEAGGKRKAGEILVDMGATYSALNKILAPVGENHVTVIGATGQPEKAYFCKPLKHRLGKQWSIHKFLYLPSPQENFWTEACYNNYKLPLHLKMWRLFWR